MQAISQQEAVRLAGLSATELQAIRVAMMPTDEHEHAIAGAIVALLAILAFVLIVANRSRVWRAYERLVYGRRIGKRRTI